MSTSARYLRCQVNGTAVKGVRDWGGRPQGETKLDASDSDSAPYTDSDSSMYGVRIEVRGIWDSALDGPFPGFLQGAIVTNLLAYSNRTNATPDYNLPLGMVVEDGQQNAVKGQVEYSFVVENKGIFYRFGIPAAVS